MTKTSEFKIWQAMKTRCYNHKARLYRRYGGRGIKVCERWLNSFENFYADMGPRPSPAHSLEREKNDGDYEPGNCKWATQIEQSYNRHNTVLIKTPDGKELTTREYSILTGLSERAIRNRLARGVPLDRPPKPSYATKYDYHGKKLTLGEIAIVSGCPYDSLRKQVLQGHHPQDAVEWVLYYQKNPRRSG